MKHRLFYGVCIMMLLFPLSNCSSENELMEEGEKSIVVSENEHNETIEQIQDQTAGESTSQTDYSATIEQMYLLEEESLLTNVKDAEELYVFLNGLSYCDETCDGLPEYSICFADGSQYYVNVTAGWVWRDNDKEATLADDEIMFIKSFMY